MKMHQVVIVGAGQAGAQAALAVRECAPDVAVTLFGIEAHPPYERPQLSKALLLNPGGEVPYIFDEGITAASKIDFRPQCEVIAIDPVARCVSTSDGTRTRYDRLLLATGSRIRTITIDGIASDKISYLRTLDDCRELARRLRTKPAVVVIGGGFIGLEVAATAAQQGCRVTVIEAADMLLARMGCPEASAIVAARHSERGLDVRLGVRVISGSGDALHLSDGSSVDADVIVAGIGILPNTELAESIGLEIDDGVVVDSYGRTSNPLIYAAGDVTRQPCPSAGGLVRLESWQNANDQAYAAGRSLAGQPTQSGAVPWQWSDQGSLNIQVAGIPRTSERTLMRGDPRDSGGVTLFRLVGERVVGAITINRGSDMAVARRLVDQQGLALPADNLADPEIPLRKFLFGRRTT
ncbi:NAD(P)/FAD-dependent oxidoreductase [Pusillimonas sp.]|uniref:NAD(P)/FAD-dependent oxidoreductase n=1 Tax=Pusillimonas sp. TaxID=3040095 RepID=UPI0029BE7832|nr:FAD-dependent oxidoreductase [Pusillimonas sp.]MDX3895449.1 FAD-dependent oxidoreductase [Pusillimonas sp.]